MSDGNLPVPPATILCVDDEANILAALRRLFRPAGYKVLLGNSGAEGLQLLEAENGEVDVVISDMRMPEMDGARFLAQVRARWPKAARILLTGYADIESTVAAINQGEIYRYIAKPWNDSEVMLTVKDVLERKALEREKTRLEELTRRQNEELKSLNASLEEKVQARTQELALANEKLKTSFMTSIRVFANLIELREGRMAGHSRRVADLSRKTAKQMNLPPRDSQDVFLAGLLHDIGKIGLPDHLLAKNELQMTPEERGLWRKHPLKGEQALMALEDLRGAARLIRSHHERVDGQGYPAGEMEGAIPLGARILAVANDYDGLIQGTLNGKKLNEQAALEFIDKSRGRRYDPAVVDAFLVVCGGIKEPPPVGLPLLPAELEPGMVLARDFLSRDGILLLAADYVLDENLIRQIREYEKSEFGGRITLHIHPPKIVDHE